LIKKLRSRKGVNAIEFAFMAPIIFATILGIFECGWFFCHQLVLDNITFDIAREISLSDVMEMENTFASNTDEAIEKWESFGMKGSPTFYYTVTIDNKIHINSVVDYSNISPYKIFGSSVHSDSYTAWLMEMK
jgi:Flp pilus assembly protein TadG